MSFPQNNQHVGNEKNMPTFEIGTKVSMSCKVFLKQNVHFKILLYTRKTVYHFSFIQQIALQILGLPTFI